MLAKTEHMENRYTDKTIQKTKQNQDKNSLKILPTLYDWAGL